MPDSAAQHSLNGAREPVSNGAQLNFVCRLHGDVLVMTGSGQSPELVARQGEERFRIDSSAATYTMLGPGGDELAGWLLVADVPLTRVVEADGIYLVGPDGETATDTNGLGEYVTDLKTLVRRGLAPLDAPTRTALVSFIAAAAQEKAETESTELNNKLFDVREALRERLALHTNTADQKRGLFVEQLLRIDERSFFLQGWLRNEDAEVTSVAAVSPEGSRGELRGKLYRYRRPDVTKFFAKDEWPTTKDGFSCYFELDAPSALSEGWILEMQDSKGVSLEVKAPRTVDDPAGVRVTLLNETAREPLPPEELMVNHVLPAMSRIQGQLETQIRIETVTSYGPAPANPEVSIIVPVYKQLDHLEAQLAAFADDPSMQQADLIYVLDSPEQAQAMHHIASYLFPIYRVPFRIAVLEQNVGFAGANNAGASIARGRLLLLLNSDVLPDRSGWLDLMASFYDSKPELGALGVKLIYEDETIQHAGMYLYQPPNSPLWLDAHYFKGLHRTFPEANVARPLPAVSGACLMIDRQLYESLGGLSGKYVRGDYEDFDICMRLIEMGRENWYLPDAELYHLEGQSYSSDLRMPANTYNVWLHTHLWRQHIEELMRSNEFQESLA